MFHDHRGWTLNGPNILIAFYNPLMVYWSEESSRPDDPARRSGIEQQLLLESDSPLGPRLLPDEPFRTPIRVKPFGPDVILHYSCITV